MNTSTGYRFKQAAIMLVIVTATTIFLRTFVNASIFAPEDAAPVGELADGVAGVAIAQADTAASGTKKPATKPAPKPIPSNYPVRMEIPSLYLDAKIQQTTINAKGAMGVPTNFSDVAWYVNGVVPGDPGTAVIDGHYDNGLGLEGVFRYLGTVQQGTDIYITTKGGTKLHYQVTAVEQLAYNDPATNAKVFDPQTYRSEIKLVTCGGSWIPADRTYDKRIIVTAVLVQ